MLPVAPMGSVLGGVIAVVMALAGRVQFIRWREPRSTAAVSAVVPLIKVAAGQRLRNRAAGRLFGCAFVARVQLVRRPAGAGARASLEARDRGCCVRARRCGGLSIGARLDRGWTGLRG